ncbi:ankyrin repeat and SOCS box protein 3-like [Acanthaster planci]|uniref:Ankyrin repeat and SOCS box protein 3-like n=1 Tax=Acanthaster planci TaxID=133434 RepID=A0A8B7Y9H8_ACAPL|nr:ankyrin repeat and SOCS box protein 3-like [Acanthaster planci]XP_022089012.1 ankyrin repeat and SOCS box protein 3-like [Acanthaster planci]XP_022089013.1 ankyrin repeat and SOCS box protein 3-like [Acanthaster planci]XP_022089014.1 ankyrin repeat and SOCS box protein 3-like [Acanthaster planci]XP_022089015.1 ankyrin repeat and SOCS box protein 3-like [Acanthaster planci]XP_022089016.1 ankyrin repeat and SOCS box protein 3-like [Acanthaster planci]
MDFTEAYPDRCSTVGAAVRMGNAEVLQELIARGASINVHDNRGWSPLHEAASTRKYDCVRILLTKLSKEDVNARTWEGETATFFAAKTGHLKILRLLVKHGGDPNISNNEDGSPILQAVSGNHKDCVAFLLRQGANVNSHLFGGWSLLHEAACCGFPDILSLLLRAGAKIDVRDDFGIMPVFTAAQYGKLDCLKLLIEHGADPNARAEDNATPLYLAAQEGYSQCVEYLLIHGAVVDIPTNTAQGFRPIHVAAFRGHLKSLKLLIPPSLSVLEQVKIPGEWEELLTPLQLAARGGHDEAIKMLLDAGCDPDCGVRNPTENTKGMLLQMAQTLDIDPPPFYCATQMGHYTTAALLLESGASVCRPSDQYCLLTMFRDDTRATELLLDHCGKIDCKHILSDLFHMLFPLDALRLLMDRGLRIRFNCQAAHGLCPRINANILTLHASEVTCVMKLIYGYVDRLCLCEHNIKRLQELGCYDKVVSLTSKPHSLLHLCRVAITEHLGTTRAPKIIPTIDFLPVLIKDFLLYKDMRPGS